jgi:fibronectin type 3 domain-containing protein
LFVKGYTGGTSWVDTNVTVGAEYFYMVSAVNAAGEGPRSNEVNATPYAVPGAPKLTAIAGNSKIILTWTAPSSNGTAIENYKIYRGMNAGEEIAIATSINGQSWVDTNTTMGTKYYYTVSAVNAAGEGPRSNEQMAIAGNPPNMPTGLTASGGNGQVMLRWSAPASGGTPAHYNIYRSDSRTGPFTLIASSTTIGYNDTGLKNGHQYWYKINAQNSYGVSGNTTAISAKPYATNINLAGPFLLVLIIIIIVLLLIAEATRSFRKKKT